MPNPSKPKRKTNVARRAEETVLQKIHLHAAGIDIGSKEHFVAVPADRDTAPVRSFRTLRLTFTALRTGSEHAASRRSPWSRPASIGSRSFRLWKPAAFRCCWSMRGMSKTRLGAKRM